jgi:hypothetical protein
VEAELGKIGSMLKSIAGAVRGLAIVVSPPAHHRFATIQNPIASVSDSMFALVALTLCALALAFVYSSRVPRRTAKAGSRNRLQVVDPPKSRRQMRTPAGGSNTVVRFTPGRRGKT